jgi:hypothetical protein
MNEPEKGKSILQHSFGMVMTRNKVEDHSHCAKKRRWLSFQL